MLEPLPRLALQHVAFRIKQSAFVFPLWRLWPSCHWRVPLGRVCSQFSAPPATLHLAADSALAAKVPLPVGVAIGGLCGFVSRAAVGFGGHGFIPHRVE